MAYFVKPKGTTPDPSWKLIQARQLVGTSHYCAVRRDLYETPNGDRVSIPVEDEFELPTRNTWENQARRGVVL